MIDPLHKRLLERSPRRYGALASIVPFVRRRRRFRCSQLAHQRLTDEQEKRWIQSFFVVRRRVRFSETDRLLGLFHSAEAALKLTADTKPTVTLSRYRAVFGSKFS